MRTKSIFALSILGIIVCLTLVTQRSALFPSVHAEETDRPRSLADERLRLQTGDGIEEPTQGIKPHTKGRTFFMDDRRAEIFTGAESGELVIANRFVSGDTVTLSSVSFYTSGRAAGDRGAIVIYEDATGTAEVPVPRAVVFYKEVILGEGGFQRIEIDGLVINASGAPEAAFFVGVANLGPRSFSLGIDLNGSPHGRSYISEDGGRTFVLLTAFPIIAGAAMIRAEAVGGGFLEYEGGGSLQARPRARLRERNVSMRSPGLTQHHLHFGVSSEGVRGETRATLINGQIQASSGSDCCPECTPALAPGYPAFSLGDPDVYEDYVAIENTSASTIFMSIETTLVTLVPETVEGLNTDGGGSRPPTGYWEFSTSNNDGTDSVDDLLESGEKIVRLWRIADEGGSTFDFWVDAYGNTTPSDGLVALYHLDEADGLSAGDSSGNGHTGTLIGFPAGPESGWIEGLMNNALRFDGIDDYVSVPHHASLVPQALTVMAWVYSESIHPSRENIIVYKGSYSYYFAITNRTSLFGDRGFGIGYYSGGWGGVASGELPQINQWYHVTGTIDGSGYEIFVDGEFANRTDNAGSIPSGTGDLRIGRYSDGAYAHWFDGLIDEVAIYNRILSPDEIREIHDAQVARH